MAADDPQICGGRRVSARGIWEEVRRWDFCEGFSSPSSRCWGGGSHRRARTGLVSFLASPKVLVVPVATSRLARLPTVPCLGAKGGAPISRKRDWLGFPFFFLSFFLVGFPYAIRKNSGRCSPRNKTLSGLGLTVPRWVGRDSPDRWLVASATGPPQAARNGLAWIEPWASCLGYSTARELPVFVCKNAWPGLLCHHPSQRHSHSYAFALGFDPAAFLPPLPLAFMLLSPVSIEWTTWKRKCKWRKQEATLQKKILKMW